MDMAATSQNVPRKTQAAILEAENDLTDEQIAERLGINRRTLTRWRDDPEYNALVGDHAGQIAASCLKFAIAKKHKRIGVLDDLHARALQVIDERAAEYARDEHDAADADRAVHRIYGGRDVTPPGGGTGLIVRQYKQIGSGRDARLVEEYGVDTGLMKEIRGLQQQAAQELGQWVEKSESGGTMTTVVEIHRSGEHA